MRPRVTSISSSSKNPNSARGSVMMGAPSGSLSNRPSVFGKPLLSGAATEQASKATDNNNPKEKKPTRFIPTEQQMPGSAQIVGIDPTVLDVLQQPPLLRSEEEMQLVLDLTAQMHYFIQFQQTRDEAKKKIRYDVCRYMMMQHKKRGQIIVQLGDVADRFFIILSGEVLIYKPRSPTDVAMEKGLVEMTTDYVLKNFSAGEGVAAEELVRYMPKLKPAEEETIVERFRIIYSDKVEYRESFLTEVLKGGFKYKDMKLLPDFFDQKGTLLMGYIGMLNTGCAFGEKGLDERIPRTATIICSSQNAYFGVIMKEEYDRILKEVSVMEHERMKRFVYENVFNKNMSSVISAKIAYELNRFKMSIEADRFLYQQGELIEWIYLIESGTCGVFHKQVKYESLVTSNPEIAERIQIQADESHDVDAQALQALTKLYKTNKAPKTYEFKLGILTDGAFFGYEDLFSISKKRFYTVKALTDTIVYRITRECLERFMAAEPELLHFIKLRCKSVNLHRLKLLGLQEHTIQTKVDPKMGKLLNSAPNESSRDGTSVDESSKRSARAKPTTDEMDAIFSAESIHRKTEEQVKESFFKSPGAWRKKNPLIALISDSGKKLLSDKQFEAATELSLDSMPRGETSKDNLAYSNNQPNFYYDLAIKSKQGKSHTLKVATLLAVNTHKLVNPGRLGNISSRSVDNGGSKDIDNGKSLGAKLKDIFTGAERRRRLEHKRKLEDLAAFRRVHSKDQPVHDEINKLSSRMTLKRRAYDAKFISSEISKIVRRKEQMTVGPDRSLIETETTSRNFLSPSTDSISAKPFQVSQFEPANSSVQSLKLQEYTQGREIFSNGYNSAQPVEKTTIPEEEEDEDASRKFKTGDSRNNRELMSRPASPEKPEVRPFEQLENEINQDASLPAHQKLSLIHRKSLQSSKSSSRQSGRHSVIVIDSDILIQQEEAESLKFEAIHNQMLLDKKVRLDEKIGRKKTNVVKMRNIKAASGLPVVNRSSNGSLSPVSISARVDKPFDPLRALLNRQRDKIRKELEESKEWSETSGPVVLTRIDRKHKPDQTSSSHFDWKKETPEQTARSNFGRNETSVSAISIQNLASKADLSTSRHHAVSKRSLDEGSATSYRISGKNTLKTRFSDWTRSHTRNRSAIAQETQPTESSLTGRRTNKKHKRLLEALVISRVD